MPKPTTAAPSAGPLTTAEKMKQLDKRIARVEDENAHLRRDLSRARKTAAELIEMVEHNARELLTFSEGTKAAIESHIGRLGEHEVAIAELRARLGDRAV